MKKERKKDLLGVMRVQSHSRETEAMQAYILSVLESIDGVSCKVIDGNIYATKGESDVYPCIVSHTDTVHSLIPEDAYRVLESHGKMYAIDGRDASRTGIGGDDKVGIFVGIRAMKELDVCKAAFFRDEEIGCVGSSVADMSFFEDVGMALQCDRKGYGGFTDKICGTQMFSKEFGEAISGILGKYDRELVSGGLTDVYQLTKNKLDISMANIECGYYKPHTSGEYIVVSEVYDTLDFVLDIVDECGDKRWDIDVREVASSYGFRGKGNKGRNSYWDDYSSGNNYSSNNYNSESVKVKEMDSKLLSITCPDCAQYQLRYDEHADEAFCFCCFESFDCDELINEKPKGGINV